MKILNVLIIISVYMHADFDSSISYSVQVNNTSLWGVGNSQGISNNKGKSGIITGKATSLAVCPSLPYGVSAWNAGTTIPYNYSSQDVQTVLQNQQKASMAYQGQCTIVPATSEQKIDVAQIFEQAYSFVENIDTVINTLVNLLPDITQGQGYESAAFLNFCTVPVSLIERINTTNQQLFGWAHFEQYFANSVFNLSLDLRELVPTPTAIQAGNAFAVAVITCYMTLLQTIQPVTGNAPVTSTMVVQQEDAIKNALLW